MLNPSHAFTVDAAPHYPTATRVRASRAPSAQALTRRMLDDLRGHALSVCLVPDRQYDGKGNDYRRLRAAETQNAAWYREFCGRYESRRRFRGHKFKTRIKRRETLNALERMLGGGSVSPYAERLRYLIEDIRHDGAFRRELGLAGI